MPNITADNAREFQARGVAARLANKSLPPVSDRYQLARLLRIRKQLDRVDAMLMLEQDPAKLDRLAAASMRLSDQEFALANRPKPGLLKPTAQAQRRPARPEPTPSKPAVPSPVSEPGKPLGASGGGEGGGA